MRLLLAAAVVLAVAPAQAKPKANACAFKDKQHVTVTGIARSIKTLAEEPGESLNTYFFLETSGPPCGEQRISVFAGGVIACSDGDKATVRGVYYAPDEIFTEPMIDLATVSCTAGR